MGGPAPRPHPLHTEVPPTGTQYPPPRSLFPGSPCARPDAPLRKMAADSEVSSAAWALLSQGSAGHVSGQRLNVCALLFPRSPSPRCLRSRTSPLPLSGKGEPRRTGDAGSEGDAHVSRPCALPGQLRLLPRHSPGPVRQTFRLRLWNKVVLPPRPLPWPGTPFPRSPLCRLLFLSVYLGCHRKQSAEPLLGCLPVFIERGFALAHWRLFVHLPAQTMSILASRVISSQT